MIADCFSGRHATDCAKSVAHVEAAVRLIAEHRLGSADELQAALSCDEDLIAAHALSGFGAVLLARAELLGPARRSLDASKTAMARKRVASGSERALVQALEKAVDGHLLAAAAVLEAHLDDEPRDFLALKLAHSLRFMSGDLSGMLATTYKVLPAWSRDTPGMGFLLGCHAFGLEEAGEFDAAERCGRLAVAIEPRDAWGLHAVSHVHEMQGRTADGVDWLEQSRGVWTRCNNFSSHVAWHLALFYLERGDATRTLALYDEEIRAVRTEDFRDVANATSLLWRLGQIGVPVGDRWDELSDIARRRVNDTTLAFATLHHLLALVAAGEGDAADDLLSALEIRSASREGDQADVAACVAVDLARALIDLRGSISGFDLARIAEATPRLGGSHAQRDVFVRTLAMAAADAGETDAFERIMKLRSRLRRADRLSSLATARLASAGRRRSTKLCV